MRRLHKTMQCAYFCVHLSEAINGRSPIIENQTIQKKYTVLVHYPPEVPSFYRGHKVFTLELYFYNKKKVILSKEGKHKGALVIKEYLRSPYQSQRQSWGFTSRSTARVISGQVLSIANCGTRTHRSGNLWLDAKLANH